MRSAGRGLPTALVLLLLGVASWATSPLRGQTIMTDQPSAAVHAQFVLRDAAGRSILDAGGPLTAETIAGFAIPEERLNEARRRLEALGLRVEAAGGPVLSVSGDRALFERLFGPLPEPPAAGEAVRLPVPDSLADIVAAVLLPPPPELFPGPAP